MDVYNFINSKDVRNYLRETNYAFTPVEAAWVVWQCYNATFEETHKAWQEIIGIMPDMPIKNRNTDFPSLHQFLKDYMHLERKIIDRFYNPLENAVYRYLIYGIYENEEYVEKYDNIYFDFYLYLYLVMKRHCYVNWKTFDNGYLPLLLPLYRISTV